MKCYLQCREFISGSRSSDTCLSTDRKDALFPYIRAERRIIKARKNHRRSTSKYFTYFLHRFLVRNYFRIKTSFSVQRLYFAKQKLDTSPLHRSKRRSLSFFTSGHKTFAGSSKCPLVLQSGSRIKNYLQVHRLHFESRSSDTSLSHRSKRLSLSFLTLGLKKLFKSKCANISGGGGNANNAPCRKILHEGWQHLQLLAPAFAP